MLAMNCMRSVRYCYCRILVRCYRAMNCMRIRFPWGFWKVLLLKVVLMTLSGLSWDLMWSAAPFMVDWEFCICVFMISNGY